MSIPARQSTALETAIGPVLDADGVAVTGCVVGDFKLKKTTGNFAALNASATLTHVSAGVYDLVLTTSDTDTVGLCTIAIDDTVNACASIYLQVMEEAAYDMLYAASATGYVADQPVNVTKLLGTAWLTPGTAGTPDVNVKLWNALATVALPLIPTTAGRTLDVSAAGNAGIDWNNIDAPTTSQNLSGTRIATVDSATAIATGGIAAASFAAGAINAAAIASDAITDAKVASDVTIASVTGAVGSVTGNVGGNVTGSVGSVATGGITRDSLAADTGLQPSRSGTAQAGSASTITLDASASATTSLYKRSVIYLTGGTGAGQYRPCRIYDGTTKIATIYPDWTTTPDNTTTFAVLPQSIADLYMISNNITSADGLQTLGTTYNSVGYVDANIVALGADAQSLADLKDFADAGYDPATNKVQGVVLVDTSTTLTNLPAITANWLTAAGTAADFTTEIQSGLATSAELAKVPKSDSTVTWNATALASIQSECNDAIVANNLDHLVLSAVDTDFATTVHANSVIGHLADNGAGFDRTTDSLEVLRDTLATASALATAQTSIDDLPTNAELATALGTADDAVLSAIAALNNLSQANVRTALGMASANLDTQLGTLATASALTTVGTNVSTVSTNLSTLITTVGAAGAGLTEAGGTGDQFTAIVWNANWDAEVQSEVTDALEATVADSVPADGSRPSIAQAAYMIVQALIEGGISGTTWTVKKPDGTTTLFTVTLNDATTPTAKTRAS